MQSNNLQARGMVIQTKLPSLPRTRLQLSQRVSRAFLGRRRITCNPISGKQGEWSFTFSHTLSVSR